MSAGKYDLYIEQGATFNRTCTYKDDNGNPIDLTGCSLVAQIRRSYSDSTITKTMSIVILNQSVPANLGKFTMTLSATDTASIPVNKAIDFENNLTNYTWDLELTNGLNVIRLLQGTVYVSPEVTR